VTTPGPRPELAGLAIADPPERWQALGFAADDDRLTLGGVTITLGGPGRGITGWTLRGQGGGDIDGLSTAVTDEPAASGRDHPNGAVGVDHVVIVTPAFDATVAALGERGLTLRRTAQRGGRRMGFRRLGPAVMEIVETPEAPAPRFWGVTLILADLAAPGPQLGPHLGEPRPAVQPGRQIATLSDSAGLSCPVAFMDSEPPA
jgi:hypothetical protein